MSYILDALRRSQAERERGQIPGLNSQPLPAPLLPAPPPRWPAIGGVAALVLVAAIAAAWLLLRREPPPPATVAVAPAPAQALAPVPARTRAEPAAPPVLPQLVSGPIAPLNAAAQPAALSLAPQRPAGAIAAPQPPSAASPAPQAPASEAARAVPLDRLTPEQRRELPPLALGGAVWSENRASRFVMLNGQVMHEGDGVAPGVTLERIGPKSALLRWRELLIELPF